MEKLGIEPIQLLLQTFNFVVMAVLLTKFLYKPILKSLSDRRKKIAEGLLFAEKIKKEEEKTENKRQEVLAKAREESRKIIEEGKQAGKKDEAEIIKKAHQEASQIVEKGKRDVEVERSTIEKGLQKQTIEIAALMVEKVLQDSLDQKLQKAILDKKLKDITKITYRRK